MTQRHRRTGWRVWLPMPLLAAVVAMASTAAGAHDLRGTVQLLAKGGKIVDASADVTTAVVIFRPDAGAKGVASNRAYTMETKRKQFEPRVLAVPVGSTVTFPNADPILHNVFSVSEGNRFDLGLYRKGPGKSWVFKGPGMVRVFCNVHSAMVAYIYVLDSPYYAMPDAKGNFMLTGLPDSPGHLEVWHEQAEPLTQAVDPKAAAAAPLSLRLLVTKPRVPSHLNKTGEAYGENGDSY